MPKATESPLVARSNGLHVRGMRETDREADFVASTDAIDSYDEIVDQSWQLDRFLSNPVVLFGHNSRELPIGRCTSIGVVEGQLRCTIKFVSAEKNPLAEQVWLMVRDGDLRAVSVGFVPHSARMEKRNGRDVYVLSDNELHEISVVPIPANPEALAKMKAKALAAAAPTETDAPSSVEENPNMDIKELTARVAVLEAGEKKAAEQIAAADEELRAVRSAHEALVVERDAALERASAAEAAVIDAEVNALVGVKLVPAERDAMAALAKKDRSSFDAIIKARPEMKLTTNVIPENSPEKTAVVSADPSAELAARASK